MINFISEVTPAISTPAMTKSAVMISRQPHEAENSSQLKIKISNCKRPSHEVSSVRKKTKKNNVIFERESQEPSTSSQYVTPIRQLNGSNGKNDRQKILEFFNSPNSLSKVNKRMQISQNPKASTSVLQINKQDVMELKKKCQQMNLLLEKILDTTQETVFEK